MGIGKNPRSRRTPEAAHDEVAERWLRGEGWGFNGSLQWDPDDRSAPIGIASRRGDVGLSTTNEQRAAKGLTATKRDFEHFERNLKRTSRRARDPFLPNCPTGTSGSEYDDGNSVRYQTGRGISYDPVSPSSRKHQSWFEAKKQMELALDDHPIMERGLQRRLR